MKGMITIEFLTLVTVVHRPNLCSLPTPAIKQLPSLAKAKSFMLPSNLIEKSRWKLFTLESTLYTCKK